MKNFVFISPNFPLTYWKFCRELKNNGMRVLGIGDCPYDELMQELKDSMHEYYKVSSLENNEEVFKAVAFFSFKYGKIDWLESTRMLDTVCCRKGIPTRFEYWGHDVNHDWPWWHKMVPTYLPWLLG